MIQRQQTLWLLLATLAALFCFMFPFATGKGFEKAVEVDKTIKAGSDFLLLIFTGASLILSAATIFLYKDRKLQIKLCLVGLLIAIVIIILYISQMNKLTKATPALFCILPFAIAVGYFMAFRNIRKDEKLVKSLDKLR
jgi:4-amino-4-deoxy-L-arabinose transferase-like glycosyltransferase